MRIVDAHTHVQELPGHPWDSPPGRLVAPMDAAGIACAAIMPYSDAGPGDDRLLEETARAAARSRGRLLPFARLAPGPGQPERLAAAARDGFVGLKLHPVSYALPPDHPDVVSLLRAAAEAELPVLFHCGDEPHGLPLELLAAAAAVPECAIILGHMGGYFHVDDALEAAAAHSNLHLETSAMPYPAKIREAVGRLGAARVIFGSDGPGCLPALEVDKVRLAGLAPSDAAAVFGGSFLALLRPADAARAAAHSLEAAEPSHPRPALSLIDRRVHLRVEEGENTPLRTFGATLGEIRAALDAAHVRSARLAAGFCRGGYLEANRKVVGVAAGQNFTALVRYAPDAPDAEADALALLAEKLVEGAFFHPFEEGVPASDPRVAAFARAVGERGGEFVVAAGHPLVAHPAQLSALARCASATRILLTSAGQVNIGGAMLEPARRMFEAHENLAAETSGVYREDYLESLARTLGPGRLVFASGHPLNDLAFEAARIRRLDIPEELAAKVAGA